ncbi:hypothetical protein QE392_003384 [Microbacterium proteolyticum]|nr:hypothetical protein [Microbacterium proteolyticum]
MVDVADGVQPVEAAHQHRVIDVEPGAGVEADGIQPEIVCAGRATRRDEHLVGGHAGAVRQLEHDAPGVVAPCRRGIRPRLDRDAAIAQGRRHEFAGEGLVAPQQPGPGDDRDVTAQAFEGRRHLGTDDPAADDRERAGDLLHRGGLAAGPR